MNPMIWTCTSVASRLATYRRYVCDCVVNSKYSPNSKVGPGVSGGLQCQRLQIDEVGLRKRTGTWILQSVGTP